MGRHTQSYIKNAITKTYKDNLDTKKRPHNIGLNGKHTTNFTSRNISDINEVDELNYIENDGSKVSSRLFQPRISKRELRYGPKHIELKDQTLIKKIQDTFDHSVLDKEKIWASKNKLHKTFNKADTTEEQKIRSQKMNLRVFEKRKLRSIFGYRSSVNILFGRSMDQEDSSNSTSESEDDDDDKRS